MRSRFLRVAAIAGLLLLVAVAALHTPPARRYARNRAETWLRDRAGIDARIGALDYDLGRLRVEVRDVRLAPVWRPDTPFFEAARVTVQIEGAPFVQPWRLQSVTLDGARVALVRDPQGRLNFPERRPAATAGEPAAPAGPPSRAWVVPDAIDVRHLAFTYRDEGAGFTLTAPDVAWSAQRNLRGLEGTLRLERYATLRWPTRTLSVADFRTRIRWTGLDVAAQDVRATAYGGEVREPDGRGGEARWSAPVSSTALATIRGTFAWENVFGPSTITAAASGEAGVAKVADWFDVPLQSAGTATWSATVSGPPSALVVDARAGGRDLTLRRISPLAVQADLRVDFGRGLLTVADASVVFRRGRVQAAYSTPIGSGTTRSRLDASWQGLAFSEILRAASWEPIGGIDGETGGRLSATWRGGVEGSLIATLDNTTRPLNRTSVPLEGRATLTASGGRFQLGHDHRFGTLAVNGTATGTLTTLDVASARIAGPIEANTDDLPALLDQLATAGLVTRAVADGVRTGRVAFTGRVDGSVGRPRATGQVAARDLGVGPDLPFSLDASVTIGRDRLVIDPGELRAQDNRIVVAGTIGLPRGDLAATAEGTLTDLRSIWRGFDLPVEWEPHGDLTARARISGRLARPAVDADVSGTLAVRAMPPATVAARVTFADQQLDVEGLEAEMAAGRISGDATFDFAAAARPFRARGTLSVRDAARLAPLVAPAEWPLAGEWVARAAIEGALDDPAASSFEGLFERIAGEVHGVPIALEAPAHVAREGDQIAITRLLLRSGSSTLELDGAIGGGAPGLVLRSDLNLPDLEPLFAHVDRERQPTLAGRMHVEARASGRLRRPEIEASVKGNGLSVALPGIPTASGIVIEASLREGVLSIPRLTGAWQDASLQATASGPLRLIDGWLPAAWRGAIVSPERPAAIDVTLENLTPVALAPFLDPGTLAGIGGRVSARLSLEAARLALEAWRGELVLNEAEVVLAQIPIRQQGPTRLFIENSRLRVDTWQWTGPGTTITAAGGFTWLGARPRFDAAVDANVDLRIASAFLRPAATGGRADISVSFAGPVASPIIEGRILLSEAEYRMRDPRLAVSELRGTILLADDRVRLERLRGTVNGGTLAIDGTAQLDRWRLDTLALAVGAEGAAVEFPDGLRSEIVADLKLSKQREDDAPVLSGTVTALRGSYREQLGLLSQFVSGGTRTSVTPVAAAATSVLDPLRLNIGLATLEDIDVDTNYGRVEAGGSLRLQGTVGTPTLAGRITLREGGLVFLGGTTYRIESGAIDFAGGQRIRPQLDVAATTQVGSYRIGLEIAGTPDRVRAELSSDPVLDQTNIVSLLVTGRTVSQGGLTTEVVGEQVLGYLSGDLLNFAGRALGLDSVRIDRGVALDDLRFDPTILAGETDASSRLTITKNLSREIEVVLSQNLTGTGNLTWIATWRPRRTIALRVLSLDDTERTYEFRQELSFGGTPARADRPERIEPRVAGVVFSGSGFDPAALLDRVKLRPGNRFDFYRWQDDRERLLTYFHDQSRFEASVTARRQETTAEDGEPAVTLRYEIRPGPRGEITVDGGSLPESTLADMRTEWTRTVFDDFLVEDLEGIARTALARDGYLRADATVTLVTTGVGDEAVKRARVTIAPGPLTTRRVVAWDGIEALTAERLDAEISRLGLQHRLWQDPTVIEDPIRNLYLAEGFLAATVTARPPRFDGEVATLPVSIVEGSAARLATIVYRGVRAIPMSQLSTAARLTSGELVQPADLDRARRFIERQYYDRGFNAVTVTVDATSRTDRLVDVTIAVDEGPQQMLSRVEVKGAPRTHRGLVTSALKLDVGAPLSGDAFYEARRRLYETGAFRQVDLQTQPIGDPQPTDIPGVERQPIEATVSLEEWPLWRFRYGLQVNDFPSLADDTRDVGPGFSTDLERSNLFGRAARLGVALRYDNDRQAVRTYFSTPRLFRLPVTSTLFAQQEYEQAGSADTTLTTITFEQRYRVQRTTQLSYGYFYRRAAFQAIIDVLGEPFPIDVAVHYSGLYSAISLDRRDDPFDANRGWFHASSVRYAARTLGSDVRFVKGVIQQSAYWPLKRRVVLAWNGRLGLADGFGQPLIEAERFFAGGGGTVRGYREDSLSPVGSFGDPVGGEALVVLNQELRFPIWRRVRGVGFLDAGNAFPEPAGIRFGDLAVGAGVGLRVSTPVGVLRFDFGVPVSRGGGFGAGRWHFSFGQAF